MCTIQVDNRSIEAAEGEMLLDVLRREGIKVPTLCRMDGLTPTGACRLCVVEVAGQQNLAPSCTLPVTPGLTVSTHSPRAVGARRVIVELLLANHPDDCLYCSRSGKCDLQGLANDLGIRQRRFRGAVTHHEKDVSSPSLVREPEKCILCGKCVRVCEEVQGVSAIDFIGRGSKAYVGCAFDSGLNVSTCVNCGQCILACPTGALAAHSYLTPVIAALSDPTKTVVVQHAPAVSVSLAEEFGVASGKDIDGKMVAALRRIGFDRVFDTSFAADLTIMEEASELAERVRSGGVLPMFTSCSPGWIKFVEQFYPDLIPNLSTCKSPQQMMGAVIKTFWAQRENIKPADIVSVSIMPCTAKKFECSREEMGRDFVPDVDYVLTTRELGQLLRMYGVELNSIAPESADTPFGERSSAGKLFGASGGVMEAAIRSAHYLLTGTEMAEPRIQAIRGLKGCKELHARIGDLEIGAAVVSGLGNARKILDDIVGGRRDLQFIEVMTCPGGCINGGGQPLGANLDAIRARMQALYQIDRDAPLRVSHKNPSIERLYKEFLGQPLGEKSHHLLHTQYHRREELDKVGCAAATKED